MSAAAEIAVLSGGAMRRFMVEAVPLFEHESGSKVAIRFGPTRALKQEIEAGAAFDLALLPRPQIDDLAQAGKIAAGTQTDITRSAVGLVVRAGAKRPDIGTVEAFKRALLAAKSISYSQGPSGVYVADLMERLGLAPEMKAKTKLAIGRPVADLVAKGEAEIGMQQIVEILPVKGAELVAPLPHELQNIIVYAAGFAPGAADSAAARALVGFLELPAAVRIIRAKGMEPG